ncbi:class 1 isoprenoid biosynthesis enzyme [Hydrotalea lipotrueae]|uniref:class 1 isoprenoid biosynthesis enzyme n=1 Tax=Hydrotalea lipotrueae TaxID=2803817 RepID=UPI001C45E890|nr:class 1 isoprenoid biosynthesis enzyme [Hydrotalea lipotrueae]
METLKKYILAIPVVFKLLLHFIISRRQSKRFAQELIAAIETKHGVLIADAVKQKSIISYAIYTPIVCDAFTQLHGRYTTIAEKTRLVYYFVMASMYDDFFDTHALTVAEIEALTFSGDDYTPKSDDEYLIRAIHRYLLQEVKQKEAYLALFHDMFTAQKDSLQQFNLSISAETLLSVTHRKGGFAVLMCYFYMDVEGTGAEKKCWYLLGTIIQMINDLFDTYKDSRAGIYTFANHSSSVAAIQHAYKQQVLLLKNEINALNAPDKQKRLFNYTMAAVYCLGFLAIEQLQQIESRLGTLPDFATLSRKDLIIDMEKYSNRKRWIQLFVEHGNDWL